MVVGLVHVWHDGYVYNGYDDWCDDMMAHEVRHVDCKKVKTFAH